MWFGVINLSDRDAVLFANDAFYRAFADRDLKAMEKLWSDKLPVCCLHPGWGPVFDLQEILKSWAAILMNPASPEIKCRDARAHVYGDVASVICFEELPAGTLVTTNIFHREENVWKMIHHQAGPTSASPSEAVGDEKAHRLH